MVKQSEPPPELQLDYSDYQLPGCEDALDLYLGVPRPHRLPDLRGPPEAQGVVRPVIGSRPPVFPFFPPRATFKAPTPLFLRKTPMVLLLWTQFIFLIRYYSCFILSPSKSEFLSNKGNIGLIEITRSEVRGLNRFQNRFVRLTKEAFHVFVSRKR
jgi:hypothetical protein